MLEVMLFVQLLFYTVPYTVPPISELWERLSINWAPTVLIKALIFVKQCHSRSQRNTAAL